MEADIKRLTRIREKMAASGLDALLCRLPHNVLMLTGYAPILGNSFALFPLEGEPVLIVPSSEDEWANKGWVSDVWSYTSSTLDRMRMVLESAEPMLAALAREKDLDEKVVGYEHEYSTVPASYSQFATTSPATLQLYREAFGNSGWTPADRELDELESVLTEREIEMVRTANHLAAEGILAARRALRPGMHERDLEADVVKGVLTAPSRPNSEGRIMAFPHVLSGHRAETAWLPFGVTTGREIARGDQVLVQLEVYVDGFWAEITRTLFAGNPSEVQRAAYEACLEARSAAYQAERAGIQAAEVDAAAREVLTLRGYGDAFRHGLGHGVGYQAISHERLPRLHPVSQDMLESGMVHNMEPAAYEEGIGIRINDDVLTTDSSCVSLTPLPVELDWAICGRGRQPRRAAA